MHNKPTFNIHDLIKYQVVCLQLLYNHNALLSYANGIQCKTAVQF